MFAHFLSLLSFALMVAAAPMNTEVVQENAWKYGTGGGVIGFIVLILDIIVFLEVLKSNREVLPKVAWCVLVFVFPIGGLVIYWLFSNRAAHNETGGYETLPQ